ncbi:ankyrin repeat domain-containing protein [Dyella mobilis]|uniref:Ankyrin repeat domain-containing protein n=2 Tax=Dyella mobilis TaxID=1849582 RepID=A0ABS2KES2_9GAMM|nr:ankyrin repeat domain-containing protein [Dyella mobilis]
MSLLTYAAYLCSPALRMQLHGRQLDELSQVQRVDAHRYDQSWFDAARLGRVDILQALHEAQYPIDSRTSSGYTATILAAYDDHPEALDYLLGAGADACQQDRSGNTALMGALYKGNLVVARRLLATRCPVDQINNAGETALSFAALFGRQDMMRELVARGADPNHADIHGDTPLAVVMKQGNGDSATVLRQLGARR